MTKQRTKTRMMRPEVRSKALGWFSIGLGLAELAAPRALCRLIGLRYNTTAGATMRALGLREIGTGIAILMRPDQPTFLWGRVAGDMVDLALLATGFSAKKTNWPRLSMATAAVAGVTIVDGLTARQIGRQTEDWFSVTVGRSLEETREAWQRFSATNDVALEQIAFASAPGQRGTEIKAIGGERWLRHFKQQIETGEILHSDASIHHGPHPARPSHRVEGAQR
jgi:hypothetical protein